MYTLNLYKVIYQLHLNKNKCKKTDMWTNHLDSVSEHKAWISSVAAQSASLTASRR